MLRSYSKYVPVHRKEHFSRQWSLILREREGGKKNSNNKKKRSVIHPKISARIKKHLFMERERGRGCFSSGPAHALTT